jgi:microcompartment protein CcmL/EutN
MESDLDGISTIKELANYVKKIIIPRLQHNISTYIEEAKFTRSRKKKTDFIKKADHCDKSMCK